VEFVESGMVVGLGHGSTALFAVRHLGELVGAGLLRDIVAVPCSKSTEEEAVRLRIPLATLTDHPVIDVTVDGADEIAPNFDLIKGGGGALLREKIVAQASRREVIAVDESKLSPALGTNWALPVEVLPFGWRPEMYFLSSLGAEVRMRENDDGGAFESDGGNFILDADFGPIDDPAGLARELDGRTAVAGHGLFLGLATDVIVAGREGVQHVSVRKQ
jgi:ribose 5-phosphate isomerase A